MRGVLINRVHCYGCTVCTLLNPSKIWYGGMVLEHILSNSGLLYLSLAFLGYPTEGLSGIRKNVFLKSELNWTFEVYIVCIMTGRVVCSTVVTTYQVGGWPIFSWLTCHDIQWHILRGEGGRGRWRGNYRLGLSCITGCSRAPNDPSRSSHNHGEGPYQEFLQVESTNIDY